MNSRTISWIILLTLLAAPAGLFRRWISTLESETALTNRPTEPGMTSDLGAARTMPAGPESAVSKSIRAVEYLPATTRDPTLSRQDLMILVRRKLEDAERRRLEAERLKKTLAATRERPSKMSRKDPRMAPLRIEGTIMMPTKSSVIIEGETYSVGDSVKGARIIDIRSDRVTFRRNGRTETEIFK